MMMVRNVRGGGTHISLSLEEGGICQYCPALIKECGDETNLNRSEELTDSCSHGNVGYIDSFSHHIRVWSI
jgi:hypothetical protein